MDIPDGGFQQSMDIPDSGKHALEGNRCDEGAGEVRQSKIIDAHLRFLIRCEVVESPDGPAVQQVFDSAFSEFGLPAAIRSDNGPPSRPSALAGSQNYRSVSPRPKAEWLIT